MIAIFLFSFLSCSALLPPPPPRLTLLASISTPLMHAFFILCSLISPLLPVNPLFPRAIIVYLSLFPLFPLQSFLSSSLTNSCLSPSSLSLFPVLSFSVVFPFVFLSFPPLPSPRPRPLLPLPSPSSVTLLLPSFLPFSFLILPYLYPSPYPCRCNTVETRRWDPGDYSVEYS